ncbi:MAG: adenylate kinase family protein [Staphylothermus sp.]|nr:adenylate kinase family protein [Staphylothermus sp.]
MGKAIVITGTPGTGKTSVARALAKLLGVKHIDLSSYAIEKGFITEYDAERHTYVIDEERLVKKIVMIIKNTPGYVIIDTHYPEIIPCELIEYVFVLRTHPRVLEERLRNKGWPDRKVKENVMAEILSVVLSNILNACSNVEVYEIDTTNRDPVEVAEEILGIIKGVKKPSSRIKIDWLSALSQEDIAYYESYGESVSNE